MKNSRTPRLSDLIRQPATPRPEPASAPRSEIPAPPETEPARVDVPAGLEEPRRSARHRIELSGPEAEARADYELLEPWVAGIFARAANGSFEADDVLENVRAILDRPKLPDALFAETFKTMQRGEPLVRKSLNVATYALRLGTALKYQGERLVELGVAGLLHKLGMARVPPELVAKPGTLSRGELASVRQHPRLAHEMIAPHGGQFERIAEIVYQANERTDGSGYPEGLRENQIRPEALMIGLVDVFEALIQPRPYRERLVPFRAVKEILDRERTRFPRSLLREFIASFSVFPPFTYVRLNSKAVARVEETEAGYPLRPKVTIVLDPNGHRPAHPQTVRLRESPLLYITGPVAEEELPA